MSDFESRLREQLNQSVSDVESRPENWETLKARLDQEPREDAFEDRLRHLMEESVADLRSEPAQWHALQTRLSPPRRRWRRGRLAALALAAVVGLGLPAVAGLSLNNDRPALETETSEAEEAPAAEAPTEPVEDDQPEATTSLTAIDRTHNSSIASGEAGGSNTTAQTCAADTDVLGETELESPQPTEPGETCEESDGKQEGKARSGDAAAGQTVGVAASPTPR